MKDMGFRILMISGDGYIGLRILIQLLSVLKATVYVKYSVVMRDHFIFLKSN